jgi:hypothetical protein
MSGRTARSSWHIACRIARSPRLCSASPHSIRTRGAAPSAGAAVDSARFAELAGASSSIDYKTVSRVLIGQGRTSHATLFPASPEPCSAPGPDVINAESGPPAGSAADRENDGVATGVGWTPAVEHEGGEANGRLKGPISLRCDKGVRAPLARFRYRRRASARQVTQFRRGDVGSQDSGYPEIGILANVSVGINIVPMSRGQAPP